MPRSGNAVVTGASGLIGRELTDLLVREGARVTAIDKNPVSIAGAECVSLDMSRSPDLSRWVDSETTIYHLAASADVRKSVTDPRHDFENTLCGYFEVLEAAREHGARVVFPSTASVFDQRADLPLSESSPKSAASPYAAAKLAGEIYSTAYYRTYEVDVRIARMFSVYGPHMQRLAIYDIVRKLEENPSRIVIFGDGSQVRDYLHVRDAARGLALIGSRGSPGEDYNLASGEPTSILELARTIARIMGCEDVSILPTGGSFPGDIPKLYGSVSKLRSIGFEREITLEQGLEETVAAIRSSRARLEQV